MNTTWQLTVEGPPGTVIDSFNVVIGPTGKVVLPISRPVNPGGGGPDVLILKTFDGAAELDRNPGWLAAPLPDARGLGLVRPMDEKLVDIPSGFRSAEVEALCLVPDRR